MAKLAPVRGDGDLVWLGERKAKALGDCSQSPWEFEEDVLIGVPGLVGRPRVFAR